MSFTFTSDNGSVWPLARGNDVYLGEGAEGLYEQPVELHLQDRISYDGAALFRSRFAPRRLILPLWLVGSGEVLTVWRRLMSALQAGGTLTHSYGGDDRNLFNVSLESAQRSRLGQSLTVWGQDQIVVSMLALDPWWYGALESAELDLGSTTAFDDASTDFDDASTPFDGGGSTFLSSPGDDVAFPKFTIDGPFTTLTIVNSEGQSVVLASALATGDQIVVDSAPGSRGPRLNSGSVDWSLLTETSQLFTLSNPSDSVAVNATGTDGNSNVTVTWRNRYLTP